MCRESLFASQLSWSRNSRAPRSFRFVFWPERVVVKGIVDPSYCCSNNGLGQWLYSQKCWDLRNNYCGSNECKPHQNSLLTKHYSMSNKRAPTCPVVCHNLLCSLFKTLYILHKPWSMHQCDQALIWCTLEWDFEENAPFQIWHGAASLQACLVALASVGSLSNLS